MTETRTAQASTAPTRPDSAAAVLGICAEPSERTPGRPAEGAAAAPSTLDSPDLEPYEDDDQGSQATAVTTLRERELAVSHWLLSAADDPATARGQWKDQDVALLACGGVLSAVRVPAHLVWAAVGTENLSEVDEALRKRLDGGAVFMDLHASMYYFLVAAPPGGSGLTSISPGWHTWARTTSWACPRSA